MNKNAVYTCITGTYDSLKTPLYIDENWDYICYTNNHNLKSDVWEIKYISDDNLSDVKLARKVKVLFHEYMSEYDHVLWMDASYTIISSINEFLKKANPRILPLALSKHLVRHCTYDEYNACLNLNKDKKEIMEPQIKKYYNKQFPQNAGMVETGIIYRMKNSHINTAMNFWWNEILHHSHRDQLSFNYTMWQFWKIEYECFPYILKESFAILNNHGNINK